MRVLVSITSYQLHKRPYLDRILDEYLGFSKYDVTIALATKYDYTAIHDRIKVVPNTLDGWEHTWNNEDYLQQNYGGYDLIVSQDDDILLTEANLDYYVEHQGISDAYIPGFLVYEKTKTLVQLVSMSVAGDSVEKTMDIDGTSYFVPSNKHSACFVADRKRYAETLKHGIEREKHSFYPVPCMSRTGIYLKAGMEKVIAASGVSNGSALVRHLPTRYAREVSFIPIRFLTQEKLVTLIGQRP